MTGTSTEGTGAHEHGHKPSTEFRGTVHGWMSVDGLPWKSPWSDKKMSKASYTHDVPDSFREYR